MRYYGLLHERRLWVKVSVLLLALCMLFLEAARGQWLYVPVVLFVVLACFFQKEHIVSQEGVDIHYRLFGSSLHSCWTWSEMLHFGKGVNTRVFVMKPEDSQAVLALAKRANPQIHIADMGR